MFLDENSGMVFDSTTNERAHKKHHKKVIQDYIVAQVSKGMVLSDIPILGCQDFPDIDVILGWELNDAEFAKQYQTAEYKRCRILNEKYQSELNKYINEPTKSGQDVVTALKNIVEHQRKVLASQESQVSLYVTQLFDAFGEAKCPKCEINL